jgi:hypothetical protein
MELRQLRAYLAVVEEGSVTAGARRLLVAQPDQACLDYTSLNGGSPVTLHR